MQGPTRCNKNDRNFSLRTLGKAVAAAGLVLLAVAGCASNPVELSGSTANRADDQHITTRSGISYGLIKRELVVGVSTQSDVIKKFGSPNNMVYDAGGVELWIYDQIQTETTSQGESSTSGISIGGIGGGAGGILGASVGNKSSQNTNKTTSSVRTLTVILDFNAKGILVDISARQGGY